MQSLRQLQARAGALIFLIAVLTAAPAAWAEQTLRVGVYHNAPKVDFDASRQAFGIFPDVIRSIARAEGWTIDYVPGTFAEGLERMGRGEIDLMPDVADSPARHSLYEFPQEPVLQSWNQVYAREDSGIRNILDLSGKRVAVLRGSVQEEFFGQLAAGFGVRAVVAGWPDYAAGMFAPFHRLHGQEEFEGTGIGLSIVQRIVTHHGGRIWAEGRPGHGAVLRFTLPAAGGERPAA